MLDKREQKIQTKKEGRKFYPRLGSKLPSLFYDRFRLLNGKYDGGVKKLFFAPERVTVKKEKGRRERGRVGRKKTRQKNIFAARKKKILKGIEWKALISSLRKAF